MNLTDRTRFTPTGVGKTVSHDHGSAGAPVHPHGCGEDEAVASDERADDGSPPRVWGRRKEHIICYWYIRFTPTGVGKTKRSLTAPGVMSVHPHGCGEDDLAMSDRDSADGSPPRVWGRHCLQKLRSMKIRFTPTGVGKTSSEISEPIRAKVHPHGCGEDTA